MMNVILSEKEYEIARDAFLHENSRGMQYVFSKMIESGLPEMRVRELIDGADNLYLSNGKKVIIRKKIENNSLLSYVDWRQVVFVLIVITIYFYIKTAHR